MTVPGPAREVSRVNDSCTRRWYWFARKSSKPPRTLASFSRARVPRSACTRDVACGLYCNCKLCPTGTVSFVSCTSGFIGAVSGYDGWSLSKRMFLESKWTTFLSFLPCNLSILWLQSESFFTTLYSPHHWWHNVLTAPLQLAGEWNHTKSPLLYDFQCTFLS